MNHVYTKRLILIKTSTHVVEFLMIFFCPLMFPFIPIRHAQDDRPEWNIQSHFHMTLRNKERTK